MGRYIDIHVRLDAATFRRYCAFDTFRRQRRWYWPVLIGMVLITVALAGLLRLAPMSESAAGVLMGLGIAIPAVIFGLYVVQIEAQIARQGLKQAPAVYSLRLDAGGVRVTNDQKQESPLSVAWKDVPAAFRDKSCVYLYVSAARAFLLPDGQADADPDALWDYLREHLGDRARAL